MQAATLDNGIPVRWMAPENVDPNKHHFSTQSDVWAFGITFWEIITFAQDVPYGDIGNFTS